MYIWNLFLHRKSAVQLYQSPWDRSHLRGQGSVFIAFERAFEIYANTRAPDSMHLEKFSYSYRKREIPWKRIRCTKCRMLLMVIKMAVEKNSISTVEWVCHGGAGGFVNEISFPEKTPPILGLREASRFISDEFKPTDSFMCCFVREL